MYVLGLPCLVRPIGGFLSHCLLLHTYMHSARTVVVAMFIAYTERDVNGGHCVPPGGLQAYSLPQPWLCRALVHSRGCVEPLARTHKYTHTSYIYIYAYMHTCEYTHVYLYTNMQIPKGYIPTALPSILAALLIRRGAFVPNASRYY